MTTATSLTTGAAVVDDFLSLPKMQVAGCIYLAVLTIAGWLFFSPTVAWSVFAGGMISLGSFWASYRDVRRLAARMTAPADGPEQMADRSFNKGGYLLKFWIRIAIIGVVLLLLIKSGTINALGLVLGLSTIVFTITFAALNAIRHYYFSGRR